MQQNTVEEHDFWTETFLQYFALKFAMKLCKKESKKSWKYLR